MVSADDKTNPSRLERNDQLIVEATASLLSEEGWAALTLAGVAHRAGLSARPVKDRYPDRLTLAAQAWERLISPGWSESMAAVIATATSGDAQALKSALAPFADPGPVHGAAVELLLVAAHDEDVRAVVTPAALRPIEEALDPANGPAVAAARGYAVMMALGLLLESWRNTAAGLDLTAPLAHLAPVLSIPGEPVPLPLERATHLDEGPVIETGDPLWDAVLVATLRQVGTRGYEAATVEAIVAEAGCSQSVLFRRYATKSDAFFDATRRMAGGAMALNVAYQQKVATEHSPGVAEAVMMREFMRPGREIERVIGLEQYRLTRHHEQLRADVEAEQAAVQSAYLESLAHLPQAEARARLHLELAMGMGTVLLSQLVVNSWQLPYDVITVPLIDGVP